jgi:tRNA (cytidine/uridine-2'-O-)-methyltransferase
MAYNIVLVEPEIPQNTGNVARTCACTGAALHLVKPMMFKIDDAHLKRAGLDYWSKLDVTVHESLQDFMEYAKGKPMLFASSKGAKCYTDAEYPDGCFILFGKETKGLPEALLEERYNDCIRIPMRDTLRCLNLSNSVAVVIYEALRQTGFEGLNSEGSLTSKK